MVPIACILIAWLPQPSLLTDMTLQLLVKHEEVSMIVGGYLIGVSSTTLPRTVLQWFLGAENNLIQVSI
jgi:hypothetical protein